jgi:hypothetical protein
MTSFPLCPQNPVDVSFVLPGHSFLHFNSAIFMECMDSLLPCLWSQISNQLNTWSCCPKALPMSSSYLVKSKAGHSRSFTFWSLLFFQPVPIPPLHNTQVQQTHSLSFLHTVACTCCCEAVAGAALLSLTSDLVSFLDPTQVSLLPSGFLYSPCFHHLSYTMLLQQHPQTHSVSTYHSPPCIPLCLFHVSVLSLVDLKLTRAGIFSYTVSSPSLWVPHPWIQPTKGIRYSWENCLYTEHVQIFFLVLIP